MARKSSINKLPAPLQETLDRLIREQRFTLDEITAHMNQLGAELSRSAIGRHQQKVGAQMENFQKAREVAAVWVERFGEAPGGDVGRLLIQMLQTVAFSHIGELSDSEAKQPNAMELMLLSKALQSMVGAEKTSLERELKIRAAEREKILADVEKRVAETARAAGMGEEQAAFWRQKVLGIA